MSQREIIDLTSGEAVVRIIPPPCVIDLAQSSEDEEPPAKLAPPAKLDGQQLVMPASMEDASLLLSLHPDAPVPVTEEHAQLLLAVTEDRLKKTFEKQIKNPKISHSVFRKQANKARYDELEKEAMYKFPVPKVCLFCKRKGAIWKICACWFINGSYEGLERVLEQVEPAPDQPCKGCRTKKGMMCMCKGSVEERLKRLYPLLGNSHVRPHICKTHACRRCVADYVRVLSEHPGEHQDEDGHARRRSRY